MRTLDEINKDYREFVKDVEKRFLERTMLADMLTEKDTLRLNELNEEYYLAIKYTDKGMKGGQKDAPGG